MCDAFDVGGWVVCVEFKLVADATADIVDTMVRAFDAVSYGPNRRLSVMSRVVAEDRHAAIADLASAALTMCPSDATVVHARCLAGGGTPQPTLAH